MKILKWIDENLEEFILIILLILITCIMGLQIVCRYIFNNSLSWSEELTRYIFIYMAFISISYCIKKWISIKIDQIINLFSKHVYVWLQLILNCILFIFFIYMTYHSIIYLEQGIESGQLSPALQIPMWWIQSAPFVGFGLSSFRAFQQIVFEISNILKKSWSQEGSSC